MELLLVFPLGLMIISDFQCRRVLLWQLILFGILQIILSFNRLGAVTTLHNILINLFVLLFISLALGIYIRFRFKKKNVMGIGDIFFILLLSPNFGYHFFIYFLIISSTITLFVWMAYSRISGKKDNEIPLISGIGICYSAVLIYQEIMIL